MLHNLHFFIPYFPGKGIRDVYEITGVRTITGRDAKQLEGADAMADDIRLAFELNYSRSLADDFMKSLTCCGCKSRALSPPLPCFFIQKPLSAETGALEKGGKTREKKG